MYPLWLFALLFLSAMVLTGLLYPTWRIARTGRHPFLNCALSAAQSGTLLQFASSSAGAQKRAVQWMSFGEFLTLLTKCSDLIVIDLREDAQWVPFPGPAAVFVLPVAPHELTDVLERLPADRVVVFYGVSDLNILTIETSSRIKGSAALYALDGDPDDLEAA
jgi:hypothetical protein